MTFTARFRQVEVGGLAYNRWVLENLVDRILDEDGKSDLKDDVVTVWYKLHRLDTHPWSEATGMTIRFRNHGSLCYWLVRGYNHTDVQGEVFSFGPHPGGKDVDAAFDITEFTSKRKSNSLLEYEVHSEAINAFDSTAKRAAESAAGHAVDLTTFEDVGGFRAERL